jgi:hypothetical protein
VASNFISTLILEKRIFACFHLSAKIHFSSVLKQSLN